MQKEHNTTFGKNASRACATNEAEISHDINRAIDALRLTAAALGNDDENDNPNLLESARNVLWNTETFLSITSDQLVTCVTDDYRLIDLMGHVTLTTERLEKSGSPIGKDSPLAKQLDREIEDFLAYIPLTRGGVTKKSQLICGSPVLLDALKTSQHDYLIEMFLASLQTDY